jgi:hypothetical protein
MKGSSSSAVKASKLLSHTSSAGICGGILSIIVECADIFLILLIHLLYYAPASDGISTSRRFAPDASPQEFALADSLRGNISRLGFSSEKPSRLHQCLW